MDSVEAPFDIEKCAATAAVTTILVCMTCRHKGATESATAGSALAAATAERVRLIGEAAPYLKVYGIRCLANCSRGLSAAIRREDGWSYVFGDLNLQQGADALVEGAQLLARSPDGLMPWRGRPEPLRSGLIARIPPSSVFEDLK